MTMDFKYYMAFKYCKFHNVEEIEVEILESCCEEYYKEKQENSDLTIDAFFTLKENRRQEEIAKTQAEAARQRAGCISFFRWTLAIIFLFTPLFPLSFFLCPLTFKWIKQSFSFYVQFFKKK